MHRSAMRHSTHAHDRHPCRHGNCIDQDTMSISTFIVVGIIIIALFMLLAIVITTIRDYSTKHTVTHEAEAELLFEEELPHAGDDQILPPYEPAPPAYVAELNNGAHDVISSNHERVLVDFKDASLDEFV